ncbi:myosin heavy-chain kinase [Nitzschia inconspicua]|uniref:Myosin heavy-chain kinase n=1 Tax=Nitzschia inconspicua TaxID=303405 RepID=A0A9K3PSA9_9STRA|nr:myosin heavy-chain kinase [Nitzschia inconspicua]
MVVAALFEQIVPSERGLTRDDQLVTADEDQLWLQYHAMDATSSTMTTHHNHYPVVHDHSTKNSSIPSRPSPSRATSISSSLSQIPLHGPGFISTTTPPTTATTTRTAVAATRKRRKRCKATKCLASLAADFDVITDWTFYFHCRHEDQTYREEYYQQNNVNNNEYDGHNNDNDQRPYLIPPILLWIIWIVCILGTVLWLILATDGKVASPILRVMGYDKISMGYVLFFSVIVEDLPQVILTFLVEDYFEENGEFNNYALVNVIASLYDTLIKLAEAFDERADIVETGIWCKESLWAHKKKVTCVVPIPVPEDGDDDDDNNLQSVKRDSIGLSSSALRSPVNSQMRSTSNSSRMHVTSIRSSVRQNLLEEAREIVSETKLPRLRFLSASKDQTVRLWDTNANMVGHRRSKCVRTYRGHMDSVSSIAFVKLSEEKRRLVESRTDTAVSDCKAGLSRADAQPNGWNEKPMYFLTGSYDGNVRLWNSTSGKCCCKYTVPFLEGGLRAVKVTCLAYLGEQLTSSQHTTPSSSLRGITPPDKSQDLFVSGYKSGKIRLWDVLTEVCLAVFEGHIGKIHSLCCLQTANRFASASDDGTVRVWTAETPITSSGTLPVCLSASTTDSEELIRPNDTTIGSQTHPKQSVETTRQSALQTFVGHAGPVLAVASVSQKVILTGSTDRSARVWNIENGSCLRIFVGHTEAVTCVAIVDNVTFLTGSNDCTIKVWDGLSATCIRTYTGHTAPVTSVSTTLQSGTFISSSKDLTVKVWVFTAIMPIVRNDDGGTLNDLLGMDDSMACMTCQNRQVDVEENAEP